MFFFEKRPSFFCSCQDFVTFCDVHNVMYINEVCCDEFFDMEPMFSSHGTCYSTNTSITELFPFQFSSVEIWVSPNNSLLTYPGETNLDGPSTLK